MDELLKWLVETGYPFDWRSEVPLPKELHRPLAQAWIAKEDCRDASIEDWCDILGEEING